MLTQQTLPQLLKLIMNVSQTWKPLSEVGILVAHTHTLRHVYTTLSQLTLHIVFLDCCFRVTLEQEDFREVQYKAAPASVHFK